MTKENVEEAISPVGFKKIILVKPETALRYGIAVDHPVFISNTDSVHERPKVYEVGKEISADPLPHNFKKSFVAYKEIDDQVFTVSSRPKFGLGYDEYPRSVMTNGCLYWTDVHIDGWIALIDPIGKVIKHEDYFFTFNRIARRLRVKEIFAFCTAASCRYDPPLQEGIVVGPFGDRGYRPVCSLENHPPALEMDRFTFRIPYDGGPVLFTGF